MKIIKENIDNFDDVKYTTVVDSVTADAIEKDKKSRKVFDKFTTAKNKKAFLGANKQPVPKEPTLPKISLDESLFDD